MDDPGLPLTLPGSVANFHDDRFGGIAEHLAERGVVDDMRQIQGLSIHVEVDEPVEVTDIVIDEDAAVPSA